MRQSFKIWQVCCALWSPQAFLVMSQLIKGRQLTRNPFRDNSGNILLLLSSQHEDFTSLFSRVLHDSFIYFFFSRSTQTSGFFHLLIKQLCGDNFFHNLHYIIDGTIFSQYIRGDIQLFIPNSFTLKSVFSGLKFWVNILCSTLEAQKTSRYPEF